MAHHELLWKEHFPQIYNSNDEEISRLIESAKRVTLPANSPVFHPGAPCENYVLVLDGSIRVQLIAENGREVVLYHVRAGNSCILTTSCLLGGKGYPASGVTENEVTAFIIPQAAFHRALNHSPLFRHFIFDNFSERLASVIGRMESVVFDSIDRRLADALLEPATKKIKTTHQDLALQLGTAREVVSRHLKQFETYGWVNLSRGTIEIVDALALERLIAAGQ